MIQWKLQPYYDPALNAMETLSLFVIILTIYSGLYYQAGEGEPIMESQVVTWIIFCAVLIPSLIFALNFGRKMWIEILKVVSVKSAKAFRFLTCGSVDITEFKLEHNYEPSDDEDKDVGFDFELKQNAAKDSRLQGFKAKDEDE